MKVTVVKVHNDMHRWLKREAKKDGRTLEWLVNKLLREAIQSEIGKGRAA